MAGFLLDTNVVSEILRPEPKRAVVEKFQRYRAEIAVPAVGWHELWFGAKLLDPSRKRKTLEEFLEQVVVPNFPILPYDEKAAEWHAAERARLSRSGKTPAFADGQIAAIAYVNELILVTFNQAHYQNFQNLVIEDWRE